MFREYEEKNAICANMCWLQFWGIYCNMRNKIEIEMYLIGKVKGFSKNITRKYLYLFLFSIHFNNNNMIDLNIIFLYILNINKYIKISKGFIIEYFYFDSQISQQ